MFPGSEYGRNVLGWRAVCGVRWVVVGVGVALHTGKQRVAERVSNKSYE